MHRSLVDHNILMIRLDAIVSRAQKLDLLLTRISFLSCVSTFIIKFRFNVTRLRNVARPIYMSIQIFIAFLKTFCACRLLHCYTVVLSLKLNLGNKK